MSYNWRKKKYQEKVNNIDYDDSTFNDNVDGLDDLPADDFSDDELDFNDSDLGFNDVGGGLTPTEKHKDLLQQLTKFDKYLKDKINGWLGLVWSEEKGKYVRDPDIEPLLNKKGVAYYINFLNTYVRDNNILTYIRKNDYNYIISDIYRILFMDLLVNMEKFGIKSTSDLINIGTQLAHSAELILMGAGEGKYTEFLGTTTSRSENIQIQRENPATINQRRSIISSLKRVLGGE